MEFNFNNGIPVVRLRAFRAIDDPHSCNLFVKGHEHVLKSIGITKVTSSKDEWIRNPAVFVIIVESLDKKKVYGGARIHVSGGSEPLPIEQAIGTLDPKIYSIVHNYTQQGTGEGCGLWNSREISGYGIGSIFLTRAGIAISSQIGIKSLFSLCAPYTVKLAQSVGYEIETSLGNNGTFYYPKLDLIATTMLLKDVNNLTTANEEEKTSIMLLGKNLETILIEKLRGKEIEIHYELNIPNLANWSIIDTIATFNKKYSN
ncbi:MAG: hypothetical protein EOP34_08390 [Rickettsiales bacterium]|nr:MAG: hypothetical protein EOP34_08390 [Rickettsiales bacterium]